MYESYTNKFLEELDQGLGKGALTLEIVCCECNAHFELNKASVAIAFAMRTTFAEYLRYVQSLECGVCEGKIDDKGMSDGN